MCEVHSIPEQKTPAMLSDDELRLLYGDISQNRSFEYMQALQDPILVPTTSCHEIHHGIVKIMLARGLL